MGARWSVRSTVKMEEGLGFGLGKSKKSGKVNDESRFRESEPEQTRCKVERKGEMSEARVFVGRAWKASRTATDVRADRESQREHHVRTGSQMTLGMVQEVWSFEMQSEIASRAARAGLELTRKSRVGLRLTRKARETSNDPRTRTGSLGLDWDWPERLWRAGMSQGLEQEVQSWTEVNREGHREQIWSRDWVYYAPEGGTDQLSR